MAGPRRQAPQRAESVRELHRDSRQGAPLSDTNVSLEVGDGRQIRVDSGAHADIVSRCEISDIGQLEDLLSEPTPAALRGLAAAPGDILLLGVAGKLGPSLARMARRATDLRGETRRIIGVSRFSDTGLADRLAADGIETIRGDLLDHAFVDSLPQEPNVIFMTGMKFGCEENAPLTWAMNTYLPALICRRFASSRIVAFSTGNVYGYTAVDGPGSTETDSPQPLGEYAMSCLGRERVFEYFSRTLGVPVCILRLNYAAELRYGVLVDLAQRVRNEQPIDLSMGFVNVIWQGDANAFALGSLADVDVPPRIVNVAGAERLSVRDVCEQFGRRFDKRVQFHGAEAKDALLSDSTPAFGRYGSPRVNANRLIDWTADWIERDGATFDKPTHYDVRDGKF
jgi:nucleoside-diphosphate-sugar epimerase